MIGPIKRDLGQLSDTEISLIIGLAFALIYALSTFPLARLADRTNRRNIIAAGIFGWSAMTALAGFANSFWQLFGARMGVGIGEAALGPATTSLLSDYWDRERLPLAFGIVGTAPFIGSGIASLVGGPLVQYLDARPNLVLPLFGEVFSWQAVLIAVGLPGVLFSLAMFTFKEPQRRTIASEADSGYPLTEVWQFVASRWNYLGWHFLAYLCLSIQGFAFLTWIVEFFVRKHEWTRSEIGQAYGLIAIIVGITGAVWSGWYAGRMLHRGKLDGTLRLTMWGVIGLAPIAIIMPLLSNAYWALALVVPITFCMAMPVGLGNTALQAVAPNRMRGQLIAIYLIAVSFLSYAFAPTIIGVMNDYVFKSESAIDRSLATLAAINYSIAAVSLALALKPFRAHAKTALGWQTN